MEGMGLDVIVTRVADQDEWRLADLLGRGMGAVKAIPTGEFVIEPGGNAEKTMTGMGRGPYGSLDDALAAIETHTRGVCRREPGSDGA